MFTHYCVFETYPPKPPHTSNRIGVSPNRWISSIALSDVILWFCVRFSSCIGEWCIEALTMASAPKSPISFFVSHRCVILVRFNLSAKYSTPLSVNPTPESSNLLIAVFFMELMTNSAPSSIIEVPVRYSSVKRSLCKASPKNLLPVCDRTLIIRRLDTLVYPNLLIIGITMSSLIRDPSTMRVVTPQDCRLLTKGLVSSTVAESSETRKGTSVPQSSLYSFITSEKGTRNDSFQHLDSLQTSMSNPKFRNLFLSVINLYPCIKLIYFCIFQCWMNSSYV